MSVANETPTPRRAAVYRLYDASGALLYIGSAYDPSQRYRSHRSKPWWGQVARRAEDWHPNRAAAFAAEAALIETEQPRFNSVGTPSHADKCRAAYADWRVRRNYAMRDGKPLNEPIGKLAAEMRRAMAEQETAHATPAK